MRWRGTGAVCAPGRATGFGHDEPCACRGFQLLPGEVAEGFAPMEQTRLYWVYGVFTIRATDYDDAERGIALMHNLEVEGAKHWNGEGIDFAFTEVKEVTDNPIDQGGQS